MKQYEDEYEKIYGTDQYDYANNYNQILGGGNQVQPATQTYQQPAQNNSTSNYNQSNSGYSNQSSYQQPKPAYTAPAQTNYNNNYNQQPSYNYNNNVQNTAQQQDDGLSYSDFVRGGKPTGAKPTPTFSQDGFDLDDFYGTKKKPPVQVSKPVVQDDGMSYSDFVRGGAKPAPVQQQNNYNNYDQYNQGYDQQQNNYDYNQQYN